jgi:hypothetical protein
MYICNVTGGIIVQYFYRIYDASSHYGVADQRVNGSIIMGLRLLDMVEYPDRITTPLGNLTSGLGGSIFKLSSMW